MERNFRPSFDRGRSFEKPVKEGEIYELEITEVAEKGDGIGRKEGFVVFVPNTKKGDKVSVRITRVLRRFAIGEIAEAAAPSAEAPAAEAEEAPEAEAPAEEAEAPAEEAEAPAEEAEAAPEAEAKPEAEPKAKEPKEKKESKKTKKSKDEDIVEFEE